MPVPKPSETDGQSMAFPLLLSLAVFSQVTNCNGKKKVEMLEKQNAEIQAAVIEIRQRLPK